MVTLTLSGSAKSKLKTPLEDKGGFHFQFSGKKYTFTMTTDGGFIFSSKSEESTGKVKKRGKKKGGTDFGLHFDANLRKKDKKDKQEYHRFTSMTTESKVTSSSFSLIVKGSMDCGLNAVLQFKGDQEKMVMIIDAKIPSKYDLDMGFGFPQAVEGFENGVLMKITDKKKTVKHPCKDIYETSNYKDRNRQVLLQKRMPLDLVFDVGKSEGSLLVRQHSHNAGGVLNNKFGIHYSNNSTGWTGKKNTIILKF